MPLVPDEIYADIQDAAANAVEALELDLIGGSRVYPRLYPDDTDVEYPCVFVTLEGEVERLIPEQCTAGPDGYDIWEYPVRIWIADNVHPRSHEMRREYLKARRAIVRRFNFIERPLDETTPAVLDVQSSRVEPEIVFDPALPQYQHVVCGVRVWFKTAEDRE